MSDQLNELGMALSSQSPSMRYRYGELVELRRRAWLEQKLLIIAPADPILKQTEQEALYRIAEKFYGRAV